MDRNNLDETVKAQQLLLQNVITLLEAADPEFRKKLRASVVLERSIINEPELENVYARATGMIAFTPLETPGSRGPERIFF